MDVEALRDQYGLEYNGEACPCEMLVHVERLVDEELLDPLTGILLYDFMSHCCKVAPYKEE